MTGRRIIGSIALMASLTGLAAAGPALARDVLGVFGQWGAFRDREAARCFAIAEPVDQAVRGRTWQPFAAIGYWPRQDARGQVNIRLSREPAPGTSARVVISGQQFTLSGGGADIWASDRQQDAAIVAAMRSGVGMAVHGRTRDGTRFTDRYELRGAATAIDAATVGCARIK